MLQRGGRLMAALQAAVQAEIQLWKVALQAPHPTPTCVRHIGSHQVLPMVSTRRAAQHASVPCTSACEWDAVHQTYKIKRQQQQCASPLGERRPNTGSADLRGGMVRFWCGDRPLSMHLRAWMMKWRTPLRSATVLTNLHSSW